MNTHCRYCTAVNMMFPFDAENVLRFGTGTESHWRKVQCHRCGCMDEIDRVEAAIVWLKQADWYRLTGREDMAQMAAGGAAELDAELYLRWKRGLR